MRNVVLFIAMSLDGFIAAPDGGVDWLTGQDSAAETADSYGAFVPTIDTVLMGWNTYHQVVTELSPGSGPTKGWTAMSLPTGRRLPCRGSALSPATPAPWWISSRPGRAGTSGSVAGPS